MSKPRAKTLPINYSNYEGEKIYSNGPAHPTYIDIPQPWLADHTELFDRDETLTVSKCQESVTETFINHSILGENLLILKRIAELIVHPVDSNHELIRHPEAMTTRQGYPVVYYPDIETIEFILARHNEFVEIPRTKFGYRAASCIGFIPKQSELDRSVRKFMRHTLAVQESCVPLCKAIMRKRLEMYVFLDAIEQFGSRMVYKCLKMKQTHANAVRRLRQEPGFIANLSFRRDRNQVVEDLVTIERTCQNHKDLLGDMAEEMEKIELVVENALFLESQCNEVQRQFEALHAHYGENIYLMNKYTYPLWHCFAEISALFLHSEAWPIFLEFVQAWAHTKKEGVAGGVMLRMGTQQVMWCKLVEMQINCLSQM